MMARLITMVVLAMYSTYAQAQELSNHDAKELHDQYQQSIEDCFLSGIIDNHLDGKSTVNGIPTLYLMTLNSCIDPSNLDDMDSAYKKGIASDPFCNSGAVKEKYNTHWQLSEIWHNSLDDDRVHRYSDKLRNYNPAEAIDALFNSKMPQLINAVVDLHIAIDRECPRPNDPS